MKVYNYDNPAWVLNQLRKGLGKNFVVSQSYLRQEVSLVNNRTEYRFGLQQDNDTVLPQVMLRREDLFVTTHWGLYLLNSLNLKPGASVLQTYPNPIEFAGVTTPNDLMSFFNGTLRAQIDETVVMDPVPTSQFLKIPRTQRTDAAATIAPLNAYTEFSGAESMCQMTPGLILNGYRKNQVVVEVANYASGTTPSWITGTANQTVKLVLMFGGFKVASGAEKAYNQVIAALTGSD